MTLALLGTIPITVKCQKESDNSIVSDSNCLSEDKPSSSKSCYAGECPVAYFWKISWGFCTVTCGKGKENAFSLSTIALAVLVSRVLLGNVHGNGGFFLIFK